MPRTVTLAAAGNITASGLVGSAVVVDAVPPQGGGPSDLPRGFLFLQITKTAGGNIDATDTAKIQVSQDGGTTWCDLYQNYDDTSPINLFAGAIGQTSLARAFPVVVFDRMRVNIIGDGVTDTYTLDKAITIQLV